MTEFLLVFAGVCLGLGIAGALYAFAIPPFGRDSNTGTKP